MGVVKSHDVNYSKREKTFHLVLFLRQLVQRRLNLVFAPSDFAKSSCSPAHVLFNCSTFISHTRYSFLEEKLAWATNCLNVLTKTSRQCIPPANTESLRHEKYRKKDKQTDWKRAKGRRERERGGRGKYDASESNAITTRIGQTKHDVRKTMASLRWLLVQCCFIPNSHQHRYG